MLEESGLQMTSNAEKKDIVEMKQNPEGRLKDKISDNQDFFNVSTTYHCFSYLLNQIQAKRLLVCTMSD